MNIIRPVSAAYMNAVRAALASRRNNSLPQTASVLSEDTFTHSQGIQRASQQAITAERSEQLFRKYGDSIALLDPFYAERTVIRNAAIAHLMQEPADVQDLVKALHAKRENGFLSDAETAVLELLQPPPLPRPGQSAAIAASKALPLPPLPSEPQFPHAAPAA
jgi:hypothetical protein